MFILLSGSRFDYSSVLILSIVKVFFIYWFMADYAPRLFKCPCNEKKYTKHKILNYTGKSWQNEHSYRIETDIIVIVVFVGRMDFLFFQKAVGVTFRFRKILYKYWMHERVTWDCHPEKFKVNPGWNRTCINSAQSIFFGIKQKITRCEVPSRVRAWFHDSAGDVDFYQKVSQPVRINYFTWKYNIFWYSGTSNTWY